VSVEFLCCWKSGGVYVIDEGSSAGADHPSGDDALLRKETYADKTLGQFPVGLFSDKFIARVTPPEINAAALKKLTRSVAEELDQQVGIRAFRSFRVDPQKEFLKSLVGVGLGPGFRRRRRVAS
jgi:hypothetical protein